MRKLTIVAMAVLLLPFVAQAKTLEELLVEKGVVSESDLRADNHMGGAKVYWNKGSRLEFPDSGFTTNIATQLQPRYEFTDNDDGIDNTSSFSLRRARLIVGGTALNSEFSYKMSAEFAKDSGGASLLDGYINWSPCEGSGLKMGQFKSGVGRQFNNSSAYLQFPDRSVVSDNFDLGRQAGLEVSTSFMDGNLMVGLQALNGESEGEGINSPGVDTNHTWVAMARAGLMGEIDSHVEGDIDWTEEFAMDIGAAYAYSDLDTGDNDDAAGTWSADVNMKSSGFSFNGEIFQRDNSDFDDSKPLGFYAQAGYFLMPQKFEIAARYSFLDCDDGGFGECTDDAVAGGVDDLNSVDLSLNYYFWKHFLKAQLAYQFLNKDPADVDADEVNTNRWIFQVSSYF